MGIVRERGGREGEREGGREEGRKGEGGREGEREGRREGDIFSMYLHYSVQDSSSLFLADYDMCKDHLGSYARYMYIRTCIYMYKKPWKLTTCIYIHVHNTCTCTYVPSNMYILYMYVYTCTCSFRC